MDQGCIIHGIKSLKYPEISCYGVIVSASCDLANNKIGKVYYLIAVSAFEWMLTEFGFNIVFKARINDLTQRMERVFQSKKLSFETIKKFSYEDAMKAIHGIEMKRDREQVEKLYKEYAEIANNCDSHDGRRKLVLSYKEDMQKFLKEVDKGRYEHFYLLPERFYNESQEGQGGMIIDLQEIDYITIQDCQEVESPGIDFCLLDEYNENKQERWKDKFWLKGENDYVGIKGMINSPRREHLIQRFSNVFARIGIDTLSDEECARIIGVS